MTVTYTRFLLVYFVDTGKGWYRICNMHMIYYDKLQIRLWHSVSRLFLALQWKAFYLTGSLHLRLSLALKSLFWERDKAPHIKQVTHYTIANWVTVNTVNKSSKWACLENLECYIKFLLFVCNKLLLDSCSNSYNCTAGFLKVEAVEHPFTRMHY